MKRIIFAILIDIFLIFLIFLFSFFLRFSRFSIKFFLLNYFAPTIALNFIYIICLFFQGAYRLRFKTNFELLGATFKGTLLGVIMGMSLIFLFREKWGIFPSSIFLITFPMLFLLISFANRLLYKMNSGIYWKVCFVGEGELNHIENLIGYKEIDEIVLTTDIVEIEKLYFLLNLSHFKNARLSILPEIYDKIIAKKITDDKKEIYALPAYFKNNPDEKIIRLSDILFSLCLLFLALPILALVCILIKIESTGPVFYVQKRIGLNGKKFSLIKFRSMVMGAELYSRPKEVKLEEDLRVTRVGIFLRKTRIDELPQLINVLKGDMSLIGPRPEAIYRVREHRALQGIRLSVKPGLTGLAQIQGYYHTEPRHKLRYDYLYIRNRSLRFNLNILLKTVLVVLLKPGS